MDAPSTPLNYLDSFRVIAWKACSFSEYRFELGPKYYCPLCVLPEKNLAEGCPTCPLTILYADTFKDAAIDEIESRGGFPAGVTIEKLMNDYWSVALVLGDNRDRINPAWDVAFVKLARIVLQEQNQQKFISRWNTWKQLKAKK